MTHRFVPVVHLVLGERAIGGIVEETDGGVNRSSGHAFTGIADLESHLDEVLDLGSEHFLPQLGPGDFCRVSQGQIHLDRGIAGRHYETAKGAVVQFTRAVAADWAPHGVTVNAICPGGFMTEPNIRWSKEHPEVIENFRKQIPMGHFGPPEDLGPLAVYLASDASR